MNIGDLNITTFYVGDTQATQLCLGAEVVWSGGTPPVPPTPVYRNMPLTLDIISGGNITLVSSGRSGTEAPAIAINVYVNGDYATTFENTGGTYNRTLWGELEVFDGDKVEFYGNNLTISSGRMGTQSFYLGWNGFFSSTTAVFEAYGNIMSLINSTDYSGITSLADYYAGIGESVPRGLFGGLFYLCTGLTDATNLVLPDDTENFCYPRMFEGCTNLTEGPKLNAQTIGENAYRQLFYGCSSLTAITCMARTGMENGCSGWTHNVANSGNFTCYDSDDWVVGSSRGIPSGWTIIPQVGGDFTVTDFDLAYEANTGNTTEWTGPSQITNIAVSGDLITNVQFDGTYLTFDTLENSGVGGKFNYIIATYGTGATRVITVKKNWNVHPIDFTTWFASKNYESGWSVGNELYISGAPTTYIWDGIGTPIGYLYASPTGTTTPNVRLQATGQSPDYPCVWRLVNSSYIYSEAQMDHTEEISGVTYGVYIVPGTTDLYQINPGGGSGWPTTAQYWIDNIQPGELLIKPPF